MDVYLVALSATRYELYCEVEDSAASADTAAPTGWRAWLSRSFHQVVEFVERERERHFDAVTQERPGRWTLLRHRIVAWLAERIAEQRLLWHLRGTSEATLHYPSDLAPADAQARMSAALRRDSRRHVRWMVIDFLGYLLCLPLSLFPGPNLLAYYFVFRTAGHLFAWMGARHGMTRVAWQFSSNDALADLRQAVTCPRHARHDLVHEVASRLHLKRLDAFLERTLPAAA